MTSRCDFFVPSAALRHPLFWGGALVLALNDHVLKGAELLPGVVTGKLSDAAGLLVAPVLLAVVLRARSRLALVACHLAPLFALALLKLSPTIAASVVSAAAIVGETWAIVADPTDLLVALPAAALSWVAIVRPAVMTADVSRTRAASLGARHIALVVLAALACGASSRPPAQAPAIDGGRVVVGVWDEDETYVFDRATGRALRKLDVPSGDPPIVFRGALWLVRSNGGASEVVAVELDTGRERRIPLPSGVEASRVEGVDEEAVYVRGPCAPDRCVRTTRVTAIDLATGAVRWNSTMDWGIPVVVGGGIVAVTEDTRLLVRDAAGATLYTREFPRSVLALALGSNVLWVRDASGTVLALAPRDGSVIGTWALGQRAAEARAVAAGDGLYLGVGESVIALATGASRPVWERQGHPIGATSGVIITTKDGYLAGLDPATGRSMWTATIAAWGQVAVGEGIVAQREGDDHAAIYDARTGRLLSRFALDD